MAHQLSQAVAFITVYGSNFSDRAESVLSHLAMQGYHLTYTQEEDLHYDQPPHVVVTTNAHDCSLIANRFAAAEPSKTPLIALMTTDLTLDPRDCGADVLLPPHPDYVANHLGVLLTMRASQQQTIDQLSENLAHQIRLSGKVEVLKNAIVRNVSHELKTPLLQVKAAVALMAEDTQDDKLASYAKDATARLEALVKNITLLGSSLDMNLSPVIVRDAIEYARRNIGRIWEHRGSDSRIRLHIEDNLPPVLADKQGLSTALQLLMDNALKFSQKNVDIIARLDGDHILITVKDYGIGIAQDHLDAIFQTFYQIDSSSTRRYGGTGVGLAIVQLIMDNHSAPIIVESQEGKGSVFSFRLPCVEV